MKIKILKYNEMKNYYTALINGIECRFDPFVSGIINGEEYREDAEKQVGKELDLDLFQGVEGTWLLTSLGEEQFSNVVNL